MVNEGDALVGGHGQRRGYTVNESEPETGIGIHGSDVAVSDGPPMSQKAWILFALWSAVFLGALDGTIVATLVAPIGSYFQKAHQASHLGTAYLLSVCCFTPLYGRLSDILGRKGAMLVALTFFGAGTFLCGVAPSMETLIAARAIAGMGGGGVMTVSSISVSDIVPLRRRGLYQGFANVLFGAGSGLGGPLGGFINDRVGWRSAFLLQVPFLAFSFVFVSTTAGLKGPDQALDLKSKLKRIDYLGSLTLTIGVASLLLGFTLMSTEEFPLSHPGVWGLLVVSAVGLFSFVLMEAYWSSEPLLPMRLFLQRTPFCVAWSNLTMSMTAFSMLYNYPLYFTAVKLESATGAGLHMVPNSEAYMRRTGKYWWLIVYSTAAAVVSSLLIAIWRYPGTPEIEFWVDIIPSGFGMSSHITATLIALISAVGPEEIAVATGISYLFRTTGQVLGVSLSGALTQGLLVAALRKRIKGPDAERIIRKIRHSTSIIPTLEPDVRQKAVDSWASSLRIVFILQAVVALLTLLICLPIQEFDLPTTLQGHTPKRQLSQDGLDHEGGNDIVTRSAD
ncbi:vacuolar amino acid permease [Cantharellus anzutake]|uniref:vacuolar amino acid permease n=1 Tax=Cantharellus anzutake TaxID=1750568 RepID=UPI0019058D80|nr:vacuolar amino acid permease [Cantharellus anzutake]KAF8305810.1 vacuolar amino acid permease [Cantharellus anzutake]